MNPIAWTRTGALLGTLCAACSLESSVFGEPGPDASTSSLGEFSSSASSGTGGSSSMASTTSSSSSSGGLITCGNGTIEVGEECEDSGVLPGDGCGPTCLLEGSPNQCPTGATIKLSGPVVISGTTAEKQNITKVGCGGLEAPDVVFQIIPSKNGPIEIRLETGQTFERALAIRTNCYDTGPQDEVVCADSKTTLVHKVNAQKGISFHVVVTGQQGSAGKYTLTLTP